MTYHDAAVAYLKRYTRDFALIGGGEATTFEFDGEKYTARADLLFVGYKQKDDAVIVAWGDPANRFWLHGAEAVILPDSTAGAVDLLCLYKPNDIGDGSHIYAVQSVEYGPRYAHR